MAGKVGTFGEHTIYMAPIFIQFCIKYASFAYKQIFHFAHPKNTLEEIQIVLGGRASSVGKGDCQQAWQSESNPWSPCDGRRELIPTDCLLTSTYTLWHACTHTCTHAHK